MLLVIKRENDAVSAGHFAIVSFPFLPLERLHIALEWIRSHLPKMPENEFLPVRGQFLKLFFGVSGETNAPLRHVRVFRG